MGLIKKIIPLFILIGTAFTVACLLAGCSGIYDGKTLFFQVGCSQCHTINGKGGHMGPDLTG
ncbi:MAG: c-type cytochrome, partial [Desulfobulbales bacterium]